MPENIKIPEINIGVFGHVDHGKTSLVYCLTGKRTDVHSEERKRGITIRLGYADATFYKCLKCEYPYSATENCQKCLSKCEPVRTVSFVDAPGHETLMATVLSGTALIDGALLLIAANEGIKEQTREHLLALSVAGVKNIIVIQNKIDLVTEDEAKKNYEQIMQFVKGTVAEHSPIIPVSAQQNVNIDVVIQAIQEFIPTPVRNRDVEPKFLIARSFDINKPGVKPKDLKGGVIGGSLIQGVLRKGQEIEIKPGVFLNGKWQTIKTKIVEINQSVQEIEECSPGGLVALRTELDPCLTKSDSLAGSIAGLAGTLPNIKEDIQLKFHLLAEIVEKGKESIRLNDNLMITHYVARTVGVIASIHKDILTIKLKIPICAAKDDKIVLSKQIKGVWHLIGWGEAI